MMGNILDKILEKKREKVPYSSGKRPPDFPFVSFKESLKKEELSFITEIKISSPSKGKIIHNRDILKILKKYEENGSDAISIVTEEDFFDGDIKFLFEIKGNTKLPVLRKDFIINPLQVIESWANGADAILLIVRVLSPELLRDLLSLTHEKGMDGLVEVHNEMEIETAIKAGSKIIGVNNRDLDTLQVDINKSIKLISLIPDNIIRISESGIYSFKQVKVLKDAGFDGVLIGTSLLKSKDCGKKLREIRGEKF